MRQILFISLLLFSQLFQIKSGIIPDKLTDFMNSVPNRVEKIINNAANALSGATKTAKEGFEKTLEVLGIKKTTTTT